MKKAVFVLLAVLMLGSVAYAQSGKISGQVVDVETGEPLPGVNVILEGTDQGAATGGEGYYTIINVPPGTYSLRASYIGYAEVTYTDVLVATNRTTTINFDLQPTAIAGETVIVQAERDVIIMDRSASETTVQAEELANTTNITSIEDFIGTQAGIQGDEIRGGGLDQASFMVDGLTMVDNRTNTPLMMVNMTAVQELTVIRGGFNAEYGNIRSGLINVVTKTGSPDRYSGAVDLRYTPAYQKHSGPSILSADNFYHRPYLDPDVAFVGTTAGWDSLTRTKNLEFVGWENIDRPENTTARDAQRRYIWTHAMEGSDSLGQRPREYANQPDYLVDASFGGPVPFISSFLGDLTFFASYRNNHELFALPQHQDRPYFTEENSQLKFTTRLTNNLKVTAEGLYGETHSYTNNPNGYFNGGSANGVFFEDAMFWPDYSNYFDRYSTMVGLAVDHVLSQNTAYDLRITSVTTRDIADGPISMRNQDTLAVFGGQWYDSETGQEVTAEEGDSLVGGYVMNGIPYGWVPDIMNYEDRRFGGEGGDDFNHSVTRTLNVKFDLTSQVNRFHQIKTGFEFNYDDVNNDYYRDTPAQPDNSWFTKFHVYPYRIGAYLQDKMEFEGLIANIGVRLDYNNPNTEWYTVDRYSPFFGRRYIENFTDVAPTAPTEKQLKISPRIGISHPITVNSKLYFNYGHFYAMPGTGQMFQLSFDNEGLSNLGNPSIDIPRTVAYELGTEVSVGQILLRLQGYYRDIVHQPGGVTYTNFTETISYSTPVAKNYEDIRGFEVRLERRFGEWITGWVNYDYLVRTSGDIGRSNRYEDPRRERIEGLEDPDQVRPLPRPVANAQIMLTTPNDFGGQFGSIRPLANWRISLLYSYRAGRYDTWDPLETNELENNVQWKDNHEFDLRVSKTFNLGGRNVQFYADVNNVFNIKYIDTRGFEDQNDEFDYYKSLHLPMYDDERYTGQGFVAGDDKPGDVKSEDKPYINMPNKGFLTYMNPRFITLGLRFDF